MIDGSVSYAEIFFRSVCVEKPATERILGQLYPHGPHCPSCHNPITGKRALETFWRGERTWCSSCEKKFWPSSGTFLSGSGLSYAQIEVLLVLLSLGIDNKRIASMANCHEDTVANWHAKIKFWESHV